MARKKKITQHKQKQKQSVTVNIYDAESERKRKPRRVRKKKKSASSQSIISPVYQTVIPLIPPHYSHVQQTNSNAQRNHFQSEIKQEQHDLSMTYPHLQDQINGLANTLITSFGGLNTPSEIRGRMPIEVPPSDNLATVYNNPVYNNETPMSTPVAPVKKHSHRKLKDEVADYMDELNDMKQHSKIVGKMRGPTSKIIKAEDKNKLVYFAKEIADQFNNQDLREYTSQSNQHITKIQLFTKIRAILRSA